MSTHLSVGVIGLGAMGMGMAQSLRRAGHAVHVFDVRADVAQKFAADGGVACTSLEAIAAASDILISVVVNAAPTTSSLAASLSCALLSSLASQSALRKN
jgi:3-hydroxyisobutyrate dehydrogenase